MITEAIITAKVHLNHEEIPIAMLSIWGFAEADMIDIVNLDKDRLKRVRESLRDKLNGYNSPSMAYHALLAGFNLNGTLQGNDIFTDEQKWKILLVDDLICFAHPPGKRV